MFQHKEAFPKAVWLPSSIAAPFQELIFPKMSVTPPESVIEVDDVDHVNTAYIMPAASGWPPSLQSAAR